MTARSPTSIFRRVTPWVIAAGSALVAGWLGLRYFSARTEEDLLRQQHDLVETALQGVQQQLEAERILGHRQIATLMEHIKTQTDPANLKIAALTSVAKNSPEPIAIAVWFPAQQEGVFTLIKAPPLAAGQKLELWVIEAKPGAVPVSAGVLNLDTDGGMRVRFKPSAPVSGVAAFAVSREQADGVAFHASPAEIILQGTSR